MENRNLETVLTPQHFSWVGDGFYTTSFIGGEISRKRMDPFFAVGYNADIDFPASEIPRGVGAHPHKGFETVTIAYKGKIEHKDSRGNHGIIGEGDVQWMTAGAGILHQEFHESSFAKTGGLFQMVQLWVNLPAKDKETTPKYQDVLLKNATKVVLDDGKSFVNVVAGDFNGHHGKATTFSPLHLYNAYLQKNASVRLSFPNHFNTAILVIEGSILVNGEQVLEKDAFGLLENGRATSFTISALSSDTIVLVLSGEPLNEPVAHYGPFVMNTQAQLAEAFKEFQEGKFGYL
jgi:redox-sensitive bicupin YhaK (pirin superfamily)